VGTLQSSGPVPGPRVVWTVALGLAALIVPAWTYLIVMAWGMVHMDVGMGMLLMPRMTGWQATDLALVFLMWVVMMAAMMLPSVVPMVRAFRSVAARSRAGSSPGSLAAFIAGYLALWTGFSAVATLLQWVWLEAEWITPMMAVRSPVAGAALLLAAGLYQFTPLKDVCLGRCRSPLGFLLSAWRPGLAGAWMLGLRHGAWCTGCCWMLMALLFVFGVMNVAWIVALTAFVVLEKSWPARWGGGRAVSRLAGAALVAWAGVLLLGAAGAPGAA